MNQKKYYQISHEASLNKTHPAVLEIQRAAANSKRILDLGCGDGTRLGNIKTEGKRIGVDINDYAIKKATKNYPEIEFVQADIEKLPFSNGDFDLIYSMFVLEHTQNPEKVINETVRILKKGGTLIMVAPNYGAPNRRSPNSKEGKIEKLINGFNNKREKILGWTRVVPRKGQYFIDANLIYSP